jgi:uncharacterized membrane protein YhaH (DUF805 family)
MGALIARDGRGTASSNTQGRAGADSTLLIVALLVYLWTSTRVVVLRLHDFNRSAIWVLALFIGSLVVGGIAGVNSLNTLVVRTLIWMATSTLLLWPGTRADNDYGPALSGRSSKSTRPAWTYLGTLRALRSEDRYQSGSGRWSLSETRFPPAPIGCR